LYFFTLIPQSFYVPDFTFVDGFNIKAIEKAHKNNRRPKIQRRSRKR
jgi:hypothetical protein